MKSEKEQRLQEIYSKMTQNMIQAKQGPEWWNKTLSEHLTHAMNIFELTRDYCCTKWGINPENVNLALNHGSFCQILPDKETGEKYFNVNLSYNEALLARPERIQRICFHEFKHAIQASTPFGTRTSFYYRVPEENAKEHYKAWLGSPIEKDADRFSVKQTMGLLKQVQAENPTVLNPCDIQALKMFSKERTLEHLYATPIAPLIYLKYEIPYRINQYQQFMNRTATAITEFPNKAAIATRDFIKDAFSKIGRIFTPNRETKNEENLQENNTEQENPPPFSTYFAELNSRHPINLKEMRFLVEKNPQAYDRVSRLIENTFHYNPEDIKEAIELFENSNNESIRLEMLAEKMGKSISKGIKLSKEPNEKTEEEPESQSNISQGLLTTSREQSQEEIERTLSTWEQLAGITPQEEQTEQSEENASSQTAQNPIQSAYSETAINIANQIITNRSVNQNEENIINEISTSTESQLAEIATAQANENASTMVTPEPELAPAPDEAVIDDGMDLSQ